MSRSRNWAIIALNKYNNLFWKHALEGSLCLIPDSKFSIYLLEIKLK